MLQPVPVDAVHQEPVWREKADFIIGIAVPDSTDSEQLWARRLSDSLFEVCCIPFFVYDLALGDIVEVDVDYQVTRVVESSGRFVFRVWLGGSDNPPKGLAEDLGRLGGLVEWSSLNLLAVDAADGERGKLIAGYLSENERSGRLIYETGRN